MGTIICAIAPSFGVLLTGRIVQALGTGLMLPVLMNTMLAIFPPEKRGGAMGMIGLVITFAPAIGPTLSGLIIDSLTWRWLFYLVVPFADFSIIFSFIYLKNVTDVTKPKIDLLSIVLSTIGFGGIVYGFSKAGEGSWSSPEVFGFLIAGGVGLLLFIWRQMVMQQPMLDLRVFKVPTFALVAILLPVLMMSMFSTMILLPLYLQNVLLMTAFTAGLTMMPGSIMNGMLAPISGKLFDKFDPRVLVVPGLLIVCIATGLFCGVSQTTGLNALPRSLYPHRTAILNTLTQLPVRSALLYL